MLVQKLVLKVQINAISSVDMTMIYVNEHLADVDGLLSSVTSTRAHTTMKWSMLGYYCSSVVKMPRV